MTRDPAPAPGTVSAAHANTEVAALYQAALNVPRFTPPRIFRLVAEYGTLASALAAPPRELAPLLDLTTAEAASLQRAVATGAAEALRQVRAAQRAGLQVVSCEHPGYPAVLHHDPVGSAPLLFVEGRLPEQLMYPSHLVRSCSVIGTRRATPGALGFARDLGRALSREGVLVVSGLAIGIDGAAHEGALEAGVHAAPAAGRGMQPEYEWKAGVAPTPRPAGTVAVLGGGHGHLHPASHAGLARRIVAAGGAVVSEWAPDVPPLPFRFLRRNRVISGLARVVVVVEARARSGTNSTVEHALDQGRTVMAVPAAPWSATGASCAALMDVGAEVAMSYVDVLRKFEELRRPSVAPSLDEPVRRPGAAAQDTLGLGAVAMVRESAASSSPGPAEVLAAVRAVATNGTEFSLDLLVAATPYSTGFLVATLTALELQGQVEATAAGKYRLRDPLSNAPATRAVLAASRANELGRPEDERSM